MISALSIKLFRDLISKKRRISLHASISLPYGFIKSAIAVLLILLVLQLRNVYLLMGMFPVISNWLIAMLLILILIGYVYSLTGMKTDVLQFSGTIN